MRRRSKDTHGFADGVPTGTLRQPHFDPFAWNDLVHANAVPLYGCVGRAVVRRIEALDLNDDKSSKLHHVGMIAADTSPLQSDVRLD